MRTFQPLGLCESLENRTFFSLTPTQAVAADNVKIAADRAQLTADRKTFTALATSDRTKVKNDVTAAVTNAANRVKADLVVQKQTLATDRTNGMVIITSAKETIKADNAAIAATKKNPSIAAAERAKLLTDRAVLTNELANLKTTLATDKATSSAKIKSDSASLNLLRKQGDDTTIADRAKVTADLKLSSTTISIDLKTLAADYVQLTKDQLNELKSKILNLF